MMRFKQLLVIQLLMVPALVSVPVPTTSLLSHGDDGEHVRQQVAVHLETTRGLWLTRDVAGPGDLRVQRGSTSPGSLFRLQAPPATLKDPANALITAAVPSPRLGGHPTRARREARYLARLSRVRSVSGGGQVVSLRDGDWVFLTTLDGRHLVVHGDGRVLPKAPNEASRVGSGSSGSEFRVRMQPASGRAQPGPGSDGRVGDPWDSRVTDGLIARIPKLGTAVSDSARPVGGNRVEATKVFAERTVLDLQVDILWPGSLLQGISLSRQPLSPLVVAPEWRASGSVTISQAEGLVKASKLVDRPSKASVQQVIHDLIRGFRGPTASVEDFRAEYVHSLEHLMLSVGASARFLGASVTSKLDTNWKEAKSRVVIWLRQKYFTLSYDLPVTPTAFFPNREGCLQAMRGLGYENSAPELGPPNPPVYVSEVAYGRQIYLLVESTYSRQELAAALHAQFNIGVAGAELNIKVDTKSVASSLSITGFAMGGPGGAGQVVVENIQGGLGVLQDWIKRGRSLDMMSSPGVPISFKCRYLCDASLALVSDTVIYEKTPSMDLKKITHLVVTYELEDHDKEQGIIPLVRLGEHVGGSRTIRETLEIATPQGVALWDWKPGDKRAFLLKLQKPLWPGELGSLAVQFGYRTRPGARENGWSFRCRLAGVREGSPVTTTSENVVYLDYHDPGRSHAAKNYFNYDADDADEQAFILRDDGQSSTAWIPLNEKDRLAGK